MKNKILQGDALSTLKTLPNESVDMVMTSPPYWALRDYGVEGQLGLESTFQEYINKLCDIFDEVKRVLKKEGTCWVNMGDTYNSGGNYRSQQDGQEEGVISHKHYKNTGFVKTDKKLQGLKDKCLLQIPSRFAIEMTNRGWILRNELIWHKPNCMPSSAKDRFTVDFEKIFFFSKNKKYWFETQHEDTGRKYKRTISINDKKVFGGDGYAGKGKANREGRIIETCGRNKRCVWKITTKPFKEAHFAVYPPELCETPIKAGCPQGGIVLDPFFGAGTTGVVAKKLGRDYIGIELNPEYIKIAEKRLQEVLL